RPARKASSVWLRGSELGADMKDSAPLRQAHGQPSVGFATNSDQALSGTSNGLRYSRVRSRFASVSLMKDSALAFTMSFRPRRYFKPSSFTSLSLVRCSCRRAKASLASELSPNGRALPLNGTSWARRYEMFARWQRALE